MVLGCPPRKDTQGWGSADPCPAGSFNFIQKDPEHRASSTCFLVVPVSYSAHPEQPCGPPAFPVPQGSAPESWEAAGSQGAGDPVGWPGSCPPPGPGRPVHLHWGSPCDQGATSSVGCLRVIDALEAGSSKPQALGQGGWKEASRLPGRAGRSWTRALTAKGLQARPHRARPGQAVEAGEPGPGCRCPPQLHPQLPVTPHCGTAGGGEPAALGRPLLPG